MRITVYAYVFSWSATYFYVVDRGQITITYSQTIEKGIKKGIRKTSAARIRFGATMIYLRSLRSTNTPAIRPMNCVGSASHQHQADAQRRAAEAIDQASCGR